jgi:hypothetical protein
VTQQNAQTIGTTPATTSQCPNGGTQPTVTTTSQTYLCNNGTLTAQGLPISVTSNSGNPTCNAAQACGSTTSGSTVTQQTAQTVGTTPATMRQCPNGGTQPTITTTRQTYLCSNGTLSAQGSPVSVTMYSGNPTCRDEKGRHRNYYDEFVREFLGYWRHHFQ